jgi:choice-of-anchor A domain-containing protein
MYTCTRTASLLGLIATLAIAATAEATPFDPKTLITDFNVITNANFATTSDVQGNVLVGGNLSGSGILNSMTGAPTPPTGYGQINVFGTNSGTWAEPPGRHVFIGTGNTGSFLNAAVTGPPYTFPGATGVPEQPNNAGTFAVDIWNPLKALSTSLGGLANNGIFNTTTGVFTPGPGPGPTVWNLTTTQLQSFANNMAFPSCFSSVPGPPTCDGVVNVTGSSYSNTFTFNPLFPLPGIIFNFENATSINIGNAWEASILAPFANVQSSAFIEGNVIANSIGGTVAIGSEIHNDLFDCSDSLCAPIPMPEPGSLALLGSAIAIFVIRRRSS